MFKLIQTWHISKTGSNYYCCYNYYDGDDDNIINNYCCCYYLLFIITLSLGDRARALRLRVWWRKYWWHNDPEQTGLRELSSPSWWGQQKVSQWLGQICSGDAADTSEAAWQAVQDSSRLCQKEKVSKVWIMLLFSSHIRYAPIQVSLLWHRFAYLNSGHSIPDPVLVFPFFLNVKSVITQ